MRDDDEIVADRVLPYPMLALAVSAVIVVGTAAVQGAAVLTVSTVLGMLVIAAGLGGVLALRRRPPRRGSAWIGAIPLAAVVAAGLMRDPSFVFVPSGALLVILPIGWLGFAFPPVLTAVGVAAAAVLPAANVIAEGGDLASDWARVLAFPLLLTVFAVSTHAIGRQVRESRQRLRQVSSRLDDETRRRAQQAATVAALTQGSPAAVIVMDATGALIQANTHARALMKRAGGNESLHLSPQLHLYAADRETPLVGESRPLSEFMRTADEYAGTIWVGPPGDQIAVRYIARGIRDENGDAAGSIVIAQDVTDLIEAIEVRDRFLDTVEHELRSPLTVLVGHVDLARDETDAAVLADRLGAIDRSATRLIDVVERLIGSRRAEIAQRRNVDVDLIVGASIEAVAAEARTHGVTVQLAAGPVGTRAWVSSRDMQTILVEFLRNAIAFTPSGGVVRVAVETDAGTVDITVTDWGVGMTPEEARRAFDRFYRGPYARANAMPGAGVGLAIASALAEANASTLSLRSAAGEGTVARLCMQAASDAESPATTF